MALQAEINSFNFLVEEKGDIATIRSKEHTESQVSFYLFDGNIVDKISKLNSKVRGLSVEEILNEYGLALPSNSGILAKKEKTV